MLVHCAGKPPFRGRLFLPLGEGFNVLRQKGQGVVEFAVVFPLFIAVFLGIVFMSFTMLDYMTITEIARSSAQHYAVKGSSDYRTKNAVKARYISQYEDHHWLTNGLYTWTPDQDFDINLESNSSDANMGKSAVTTITLRRNDSNSLIQVANNFLPLPETLNVEYRFYTDRSDE